jgi:transcriptional regulator with GAF, ATPase, and Fis domain
MREGELGRVYTNGEAICREGERGEVMYVIQSGKVKITKHAHTGELTLATLESGDAFGEMALFDKLPRSATATALGEARVLSVDKKKLFATISNDPTLVFKILETMSQRIRRLDEVFAVLSEAKTEMLKTFCNLDDTCQMVLTEAKDIVKAENGSIMVYDEKIDSLSIKAAFGAESDKKLTFASGEGIAGDVFKSGRAELVNNVAIDDRFKPGGIQIRSILCVPIKCNTEQGGVINMSLYSDRLFTIDDLKALNSFTTYAGIAIQNAKNFSSLQNAADKILKHATLLNM